MKFPKLFIGLSLLLSLVGCSSNGGSIAGEYRFQLGPDTGTYTAIKLEMSNESAGVEDIPSAKKFTLRFILSGESMDAESLLAALFKDMQEPKYAPLMNGTSSEPTSEQPSQEATASSSVVEDKYIMQGYYYTDGQRLKEGEVVHLGLNVFGLFEVDPSITEKLLYATYGGDVINVVIPVSIDDLFLQLYWYGYRISTIEDLINPTSLKEEDPRFEEYLTNNGLGTHPNELQIQAFKAYQKERQINKPEGYSSGEDFYVNYRDFHTLKMGLNRNG